MAVSSLDTLVAAMGSATLHDVFTYHKTFTPQVAGGYTSLFNVAGQPGADVAPTPGVAGAVPTDATLGAFPFTNPSAPALSYLSHLSLGATQAGVLTLYDRLWHNSGLSPTVLTAQTVNSVALTRPDALGADAEAWFQVYGTAMGGGTTAPTITYTDQAGNTGNTGTAQGWAGSAGVWRTFPFALAAGDTGVRSIQAYTNAATLTGGAFGLVIRRKVATVFAPGIGLGSDRDFAGLGMPRVYDDACLELLWLAGSTTAMTASGDVDLIQG